MSVPPNAIVIDGTIAAAWMSLQLAALGVTAFLVVERIRMGERLARLEATEAHREKFMDEEIKSLWAELRRHQHDGKP